MRAPSRSTPACRRATAWCRRAPRSASMPPSLKASRANITSASPMPMPIGPRSPTTSTASRMRRALPATTSRSRPWRIKYWGRSARSRSTTPTLRSASPRMTSARSRARSATCTRAKSCGRTRAGGCASAAQSSQPSRRGGDTGAKGLLRFRRNVNRNALNLGVHRIGIDDDLRHQREMTRRQRAGEVDGEARILSGWNLARQHDAAFGVGYEITAFGSRTLERVGCNRLQRLAHDVVTAQMLLDQLDVAEQPDPITLALDLGDEPPARDGIGVVGAHAQRIAEIAKSFERHAVGRPAFELIGAVGHQEVPALLVERLERGPTFASVIGAHQRFQRIGAVSFALEAL